MANLENLTAQVAANNTVIDSALTLIRGLKERLDAAGTDEAKLKALSDSLATKDEELASAITQNTPSA